MLQFFPELTSKYTAERRQHDKQTWTGSIIRIHDAQVPAGAFVRPKASGDKYMTSSSTLRPSDRLMKREDIHFNK
jgi:hypothetical protein